MDILKGKIREETDLEKALKDAELVVESVPENLEIKQKVFKELGEKANPRTIFATNSSSMPISLMEENSGRPEKCLNIHFYNILEGMNMADVMGGTRDHAGCHGQRNRLGTFPGMHPPDRKKGTLRFLLQPGMAGR